MSKKYTIVHDYSSPNHGPRPQGCAPDMIVIHYTGMPDAMAALMRLCDPQAQVSAHYLIDEGGLVYALVAEEKRAWHAGVSAWQDRVNMNDHSIGIELVNPGHEFGYRAFPEVQIAALEALLEDISVRFFIRADHFVGHSDIAPMRKMDPGEAFPWQRLAKKGFGLWPEPAALAEGGACLPASSLLSEQDILHQNEVRLQRALYQIGYRFEAAQSPISAASFLSGAIMAFQRHFCPHNLSGRLDSETLLMAENIAKQVMQLSHKSV